MSTEEEFLDFWDKNYMLKAVPQFRPQKEKYIKDNPEMSYRKWLKSEGLYDYRSDFMIPCKKLWVKGITLEVDGIGHFSHNNKGSERDRQKNMQNLLLGYLTLRFSTITINSNMQYVCDKIDTLYFNIKGKYVEKKR